MAMTIKTAVITGCAGFIGSHLTDSLLRQGISVFGIDSLRTGNLMNLESAMGSPRFTFINSDVRSPDLIGRVPTSVDVIFHLAAISSVKMSIENPIYVNDVNVTGTINMLNIAVERGARFVFSSSAAVYGQAQSSPIVEESPISPLSPYAASKIAAEQYVRAFQNSFGIDSTILRYFNVYGPRQAESEYSGVVSIFINRLLHDQPIIINGDGKQTRSFIYVDDVVQATRLAATEPRASGQIINVGGNRAFTVEWLVRTLRENIPESRSEVIYGADRVGDIRYSQCSMERARRLLDFEPTVSIEEGLMRTVEWYRCRSSDCQSE